MPPHDAVRRILRDCGRLWRHHDEKGPHRAVGALPIDSDRGDSVPDGGVVSLDHAVLDVLEELLDLRLQLRGNTVCPVMER